MNREEQFYRIEAYLEGGLLPEEQAAFEAEMANNPGLAEYLRQQRLQRAAVEVLVQDTLQAKLDAWASERKDEPMPHPQKSGRTRRWWIIGIAALLFVLIWSVFMRESPEQMRPPSLPLPPDTVKAQQNERLLPDTNSREVAPKKEKIESSSPLPAGQTRSKNTAVPIAQVNPEDFAPNPGMEAYANASSRSENGLKINMTEPLDDAGFSPDPDGWVTIRFAGTIEGTAMDATAKYPLSVYNNHDADPLFSVSLICRKDHSGRLQFELQERRKLSPGLYYFTIAAKTVHTGRFTVRGR